MTDDYEKLKTSYDDSSKQLSTLEDTIKSSSPTTPNGKTSDKDPASLM